MASDDKPPASPFDIIFKSYPHIAEQIVRNIPRHLRWNVAAVNSDFYNMICEMDSKKHRIAIEGNSELYKEVLESDLMDSILNTGREIDELKICCLNLNPRMLQQLIKIAEIYGKDIKRLHWFDCKIDLKKDIHLLIQFFEELSNLQELEANDCNEKLQVQEAEIPSIAFKPILKSLKSFKCVGGYSHIMSKFIAKDTLTEFHHECAYFFDYAAFTRNQANLKSITFDYQSYQDDGEEMLDINDYKSLKHLEKFDFTQVDDDVLDEDDDSIDLFIQQLIRDHPNLRELNFYHDEMKWNNPTLRTIGEHGKELEKLNLVMDDDNSWSFMELRHLKQLKEIEILIKESYDDDSDDEDDDASAIFTGLLQLSKLSMETVKKFALTIYKEIEFEVHELLMNFGNHWSNIEEFKCYSNFKYTATNPNVIDTILQNFTKLKSLKLNYSKKTTEHNFPLIIQRLSTLDKLKEIEITFKLTDDMRIRNDDLFDSLNKLCRRVSKCSIGLECAKVPEAFERVTAYWSSRNDYYCTLSTDEDFFSFYFKHEPLSY